MSATSGRGRRLAALACLILLTTGTGWAAYVQKRPCLQHAWVNDFQYTRHCYSDIYPLYTAEKLNVGAVPYRDHPVEYPVLIGGAMLVASNTAHAAPPPRRQKRNFEVTAILLGACLLLVTATTAQLAGRRRWDAVMIAVSPVVLFYAFYNWDLIAMAFAGLGMEAWRRRKPALAGVLFGLGAATKIYPAFLLVALLPLCWRAGQLRAWVRAAGAGVAAWIAVNLPIYLLYRNGWLEFYRLSRRRGAEIDTVWYQLRYLTDRFHSGLGRSVNDLVAPALTGNQSPGALNLLTLMLLVFLWSLIYLLVLRAPVRPRVPAVAFLVVVAFLLVNKVWSPQYALWYVPLGVLALPRWRVFVPWQIAELFVFYGALGYLAYWGDPAHGVTAGRFFVAVLVRNLVLIAMSVLMVRDMYKPDQDVVRRDGTDDPAGGVLDGAPENWPQWRRSRGKHAAGVPATHS
ncbi:MAG: glycosyltransferase 87 family protein [Actinomycetota bacterium]